jgi:hypothetical protein
MRGRSAIEPFIGHMKAKHVGRNYLWYGQGDVINAVLAPAGHNFSPCSGG